MDLIPHDWMIGNTYLKLKLFKWKIPFKALYLPAYCLPYKDTTTRKVRDFQKTSTNKEIYIFYLV